MWVGSCFGDQQRHQQPPSPVLARHDDGGTGTTITIAHHRTPPPPPPSPPSPSLATTPPRPGHRSAEQFLVFSSDGLPLWKRASDVFVREETARRRGPGIRTDGKKKEFRAIYLFPDLEIGHARINPRKNPRKLSRMRDLFCHATRVHIVIQRHFLRDDNSHINRFHRGKRKRFFINTLPF